MAEYRNRTTGEVKTQGEWRRAHSDMSLPRVWNANTLDALDLDPVLESPKPTPGQYQHVVRDGVVQDSKNNWIYAWKVVDMFEDYTDEDGNTVTKSQQEQDYQARLDSNAAESIRKNRDTLLAETDWVATKHLELGEAVPTDWATYRQGLRDITTHANFPYLTDEDWPTKPVE